MLPAIVELFSSKKFVVLLFAIVAFILIRRVFQLSQLEADRLIALVCVWLIAQGIADAGTRRRLPRQVFPTPPN